MVEMDSGAVCSLRGSGGVKRHIQLCSRAIEGRNILALVPQAARRQHEVGLPSGAAACRSTTVVNRQDLVAQAVNSSSFGCKCSTRGNNSISPAQAGGDKL